MGTHDHDERTLLWSANGCRVKCSCDNWHGPWWCSPDEARLAHRQHQRDIMKKERVSER